MSLGFRFLSAILALILAGCASQTSNNPKPSNPPPPTPPASATVSVSPAAASLPILGKQQFTATLNGQASSAVTWEVNGTPGGTQQSGFISASGLYAAPISVPTKSDGSGGSTTDGVTISVTAVSTANASASASAAVTILAPPNANAQSGAIQLGT